MAVEGNKYNIQELLRVMIDQGGSDLHITAGSPPRIRLHGKLAPMSTPALTGIESKQLCYSILTDAQKHKFEEENELDFSFGIKGLSRFRGNLFVQRGTVAGAFRTIPFKIMSFQELGLPPIMEDLSKKPRGLVLVTGPTGSGKSTTLASIIDKINTERAEHIITVEDPIEYLHNSKMALVNQREVGYDTHAFKKALKYILRQDPDVVLLGELRDMETIETALTIAEKGHICFATLNTNSCVQTINRIVDVFSADQQQQVRVQLSLVLEAVLCQTLVPRADRPGRAAAVEVMVGTAAIRNLIREGKTFQIPNVIQTGSQYGMQSLDQALVSLCQAGAITEDHALARCSSTEELGRLLTTGPGLRLRAVS